MCSDIGEWKRKNKKSTDNVNICFMIILHVDRIIRTMVESDRSSFTMNFTRKCYYVLFSSFLSCESPETKKKWTFFLLCVKLWSVLLPVFVYVVCNLTKMSMQLDCYAHGDAALLNLTKKKGKERNFRSLHCNVHSSLSIEYHLGFMNDIIELLCICI